MSGVYDLAGARKAGISDEDSLSHLASVHGYDLAGARAAGIPDSESLSHLAVVKAAPEPVVEKESPEAMGGIGATVGAVGAAGDVLYSKGRPLFRIAEKAMGMDTGAPAVKPRTFLDPAAVAEQAIARRTATAPDVTGSPSAVKNWGVTQHEGEFLGGSEYKEADKIKKEAMAFEKANPTQKVLPGSLIAVPEEEAKRLAQQRAELAAQEDIAKQAEVRQVAQTRAERLGERAELKGKSNKFGATKGAGSLLGKAALPVVGGYELGSQGAQAYNRLTRPDLTARDVGAGAANVVGAGAGALSMVPSKYRIPAAILSQGAGAVANWLDKRNPRNEEVIEIEKKAAGGLAGYADGGGPKLPGKFGKVQKVASVLGTALKPLARAPAKSKAEIEAIAQRMAPQEMGEFVRAPGKTTNVAGASKKQYEREQGLQHDIRNVVGTEGLPEIDYHKRIGDVAMMLPGDKSIVGDIHSVAGIPLEKAVRAEGGKGFPVNYALENPDVPPELWTSTGQVAKNYQNLGRKVAQEYGAENVLPHYANMPQGMGYSQHFADTLLRGLRPAGADLGKATDMMRTGSFKGKSFPDFPGFENMDDVYELMKHNPEMRQLFTNRLQVQDVAKSLGLPPTYGTDALHAVTAPSLRNLETGAGGHLVGRLDLERQMSPSTHGGYIPDRDPGLNIPGEAIGRTSNATPYEMLYPDLLHNIRTNPITYETKSGKAMIVPEFGRLKMDSPRQIIDPQFADEMAMYKEAMKKITGKAAGGSVMPNVSLETKDIPNETGMPGVGYMQAPQGAMARLKMEKELEKARLRAGVSGMAMAIPGMHGVKTMPGEMDIGANFPVGRGNLDISARRSINPIPGRGHEQGINAQYTMPFAGGGKVGFIEEAATKIPSSVVKAYKLFRTKANKPDELYPLFVNANKPVPVGEWVNAEVGPVAASGKVKSKLGELAYRPGWHAGDLPVATHIGGKSAPGLKAPDFRRPDEVWAEVEMPADVDWQEIANQRARLNKAGQPIPSTAHITDAIPEGGHYRYKTSPNMQGNWLIGGGMKVNKVLTDEEVQAINEAAGVADLPRFTKFDEKAQGGLVGYAPGGLIKGALSFLKGKADDVTTKYHPLVQKGLAEGRIDPADAQWMSDYAYTPGNSQVETGTGAFKDQSERMQNFVGRIRSGEVKTPSGWEK